MSDLRYKLTMRSPSGQAATVAITQFVFATTTHNYTLTLTTTADRETQYASTFDKIDGELSGSSSLQTPRGRLLLHETLSLPLCNPAETGFFFFFFFSL